MAVVGPSRHSSRAPILMTAVSMSMMHEAGGQPQATAGGLHAATAQPYYHPQHAVAPAHTQEQVQPDRPIGYGAFGVVW